MPTKRKRRKKPTATNGRSLHRTRTLRRVDAARAVDSNRAPKGRLILIGGAEDREGEMLILKQVAARARGGRLAVITAASSEPDQMWALYRQVFTSLGVDDVVHARVES